MSSTSTLNRWWNRPTSGLLSPLREKGDSFHGNHRCSSELRPLSWLFLLLLNFKKNAQTCVFVCFYSLYAWTVFAWVNERNNLSVSDESSLFMVCSTKVSSWVFPLMNVDQQRCFFQHKDKFSLLCIRWLIQSLHEQRAGKKWCNALWLRQGKTWALPLTPSDHVGQKYWQKYMNKMYLLIVCAAARLMPPGGRMQ